MISTLTALLIQRGPGLQQEQWGSIPVSRSPVWSQGKHKELSFSFPPRTPLKNIQNMRQWLKHHTQIPKCMCPCFACLIPSSECYDLQVTGRKTDSRVTKCLRGRNRTRGLQIQIVETQLEFYLQVLYSTPQVFPGWEGRGEVAKCQKGEVPKMILPSIQRLQDNITIGILVSDTLSDNCFLSPIHFLIPGIFSTLKTSTVPELPKPIQVRSCSLIIFHSFSGHAVLPWVSRSSGSMPSLLSAMISLKLCSSSSWNTNHVRRGPLTDKFHIWKLSDFYNGSAINGETHWIEFHSNCRKKLK